MNFLTVDTFHQEIAKGGIKLVTFVNPGCQVCAIVYPNVEEAVVQYPDKLALYRVWMPRQISLSWRNFL